MDDCINVDIQGAPNKPDIIADARNLPFPDSSIDWIETHQMLEHLELQEGFKAMAEWARVIKSGGYLLVTVPDILNFTNGFMASLGYLPEVWPGIVKFIYGGTGYMAHKCAFSPQYLIHKVTEYGFNCETFPWHLRASPSFAVLGCRK